MNYFDFIKKNWRFLCFGIVFNFFSSTGQTFYISIFGGEFRRDFNLSEGDFGFIYMIATLFSAGSLIWLGRLIDPNFPWWEPRHRRWCDLGAFGWQSKAGCWQVCVESQGRESTWAKMATARSGCVGLWKRKFMMLHGGRHVGKTLCKLYAESVI